MATDHPIRTDVSFDSNVLLYLADSDRAKSDRTEALLVDGGVVTPLVLAEVAFVMAKRWKRPWVEVNAMLATFRANTSTLPLTSDAFDRGIKYAERYQLQIYDAIIVASAVIAGCTTLYSEDMHNGLVIDGLTIRNPFVTS